MPGGASLARAYGVCRPGQAKPPPGTVTLTLRCRPPKGLFRQLVCGFAFQHRPDNYRAQQVEDSQYREQRAETDSICERTADGASQTEHASRQLSAQVVELQQLISAFRV